MAGDGHFELSNKIKEWLPNLKGAPFACFLALASHRGKNTEAWPSINTLVRETGYGRRQVLRGLRRLEELKYIVRVKTPGKSNRYELTAWFLNPPRATRDKNVTSDKKDTSTSSQNVTTPVAKMSLPPVSKMSPEEGSSGSPEGPSGSPEFEEEPLKKEPPLRGGVPSKANTDPWLALAKHFRKRFPGDRDYPIKATRDHLENEYDGEYTFEEVYDQIDKRVKEGAEDLKPWQLFTKKRAPKTVVEHPTNVDAWVQVKAALNLRDDLRVKELKKVNPLAAKVLSAMGAERVWFQTCTTVAENPDATRREFMRLYDEQVKHEAAREE